MSKTKTISKIIELKENKKRELELELKKSLDALEEEEWKLLQMEKEYEGKKKEFDNHNRDCTLNIDRLNSYYEFFSYIDRSIQDQKNVCIVKQKEMDEVKSRYVAIHQDKRSLEIINNKMIKKEEKARMESEQKENDFISIARKAR